ncbi:hypothetical protein DB345_13840 [Spartobacteria bacterium LR76]|nr:hypothetical protein DB345_13840 [Spartobacteria bacterium LR76]
MIFLLDENFPRSASGFLEEQGHEVYDIRSLGLRGAADTKIVSEALELGAVILTTDRDFFHTLHHNFPDHAGVIVIAVRQPSREAILSRLRWFLTNIPPSQLPGRAFQLRDRTWLSHPPLG